MATYYFIGIKGAGMSSLALLMSDSGHQVKGSDLEEHFFTQDKLEARGIEIYSFDDRAHIVGADVVICGNAFPDTHPQIAWAIENGFTIKRYHEFLGDVANHYTSVAVTGTHGKTTTTGMLAAVLTRLDRSGYLIGDGTGLMQENAKYFAFEACEYRNHFHAYTPDYAIVTNVDFDHPDFFTDLDAVKKTFVDMAKNVKQKLIVCGDDAIAKSIDFEGKPTIYYGINGDFDVRATDVIYDNNGATFTLFIHDVNKGSYSLPFFGEHMLQNALGVIAVCVEMNFDVEAIIDALSQFSGVARRFTEKKLGSNVIIDDYAHHPKEIAVTLKAISQKYENKEKIVVFQPHTFSRTKALLDEFVESLSRADKVYILDIFGSAREAKGDISNNMLIEKMDNAEALNENDLQPLLQYQNAVIIFMGAGNVNALIPKYAALV